MKKQQGDHRNSSDHVNPQDFAGKDDLVTARITSVALDIEHLEAGGGWLKNVLGSEG